MDAFFADYFERLRTLNREFREAYAGLPAEALDWCPGQDMNTFGVLVVHTTGAARFWIGVALDDVPDRNRDLEFQARGLSAAELDAHFARLEADVQGLLERLSLADLAVIRTVPNRDRQCSAGWALLHALEHTGLHLGHAQITRQLWEQR